MSDRTQEGRRQDARNLRAWLHRIEERCARKGASVAEADIRVAALAALRGDVAPGGCGEVAPRRDGGLQ